jgi:hypothetical protein
LAWPSKPADACAGVDEQPQPRRRGVGAPRRGPSRKPKPPVDQPPAAPAQLPAAALLLLSFLLLLGGSVLFTNAVEWLGHQLRLGQGAVGSILAAVGTALPESLIPIVAIVGGSSGGGQVAVGAIVGAPFLLATIALALVGVAAVAFRRRRRHGARIAADRLQSSRDLLWFGACFAVAVGLGLGAPRPLQLIGAVGLLLGYATYAVRTVKASAGSNRPPPAPWSRSLPTAARPIHRRSHRCSGSCCSPSH